MPINKLLLVYTCSTIKNVSVFQRLQNTLGVIRQLRARHIQPTVAYCCYLFSVIFFVRIAETKIALLVSDRKIKNNNNH